MQNKIRTNKVNHCLLCENSGNNLYQNLEDNIFNVEGKWNLSQCSNKSCGFIWQNPMIIKDDIYKIYKSYYTHKIQNNTQVKHNLKSYILNKIKKIYSFFVLILFIKYNRDKYNKMDISNESPGKMLEIGAGDGSRLNQFKNMGWDVVGIEIDNNAILSAKKKYNIELHHGELTDIKLPPNSFDAIIMNHVVEHLHNPIEVISKCYELITQNGKLVITTPNSNSLSHSYFKHNWRGLEPPRHLYLFNQKSLKNIAIKAGFNDKNIKIKSFSSLGIYAVAASFELKKYSNHKMNEPFKMSIHIKAIIFQFIRFIIQLFNKKVGENLILNATK